MPSPATTLRTPRLVLSPHTGADFADSAAMWADPRVTRHIGGRPFSTEESWTRLLRYVGHWVMLGFGYWCVREADSGRFVGELGFANLNRELEPSFGDAPEIGWALAAHAQGRGFAEEACRAAVGWGEARFGPVRTVCLIDPANTPSLRLAERLGYVAYARTTYRDHAAVLFERRP